MESNTVSVETPEPAHFSSASTLPVPSDQKSSEKSDSRHISSASTLRGKTSSHQGSDHFDEKSERPKSPAPVYFPPDNPFDDRYLFGEVSSEKAKLEEQISRAQRRNKWLTPPKWLSWVVQALGYLFMACVVYFFFVGVPLWNGAIYNFW